MVAFDPKPIQPPTFTMYGKPALFKPSNGTITDLSGYQDVNPNVRLPAPVDDGQSLTFADVLKGKFNITAEA